MTNYGHCNSSCKFFWQTIVAENFFRSIFSAHCLLENSPRKFFGECRPWELSRKVIEGENFGGHSLLENSPADYCYRNLFVGNDHIISSNDLAIISPSKISSFDKICDDCKLIFTPVKNTYNCIATSKITTIVQF